MQLREETIERVEYLKSRMRTGLTMGVETESSEVDE